MVFNLIGDFGGEIVELDCSYYRSGMCGLILDGGYTDKRHSRKKCPFEYRHCCCHCPYHFACYAHAKIGCNSADEAMIPVFDDPYDEQFRLVNENENDICPINGFINR